MRRNSLSNRGKKSASERKIDKDWSWSNKSDISRTETEERSEESRQKDAAQIEEEIHIRGKTRSKIDPDPTGLISMGAKRDFYWVLWSSSDHKRCFFYTLSLWRNQTRTGEERRLKSDREQRVSWYPVLVEKPLPLCCCETTAWLLDAMSSPPSSPLPSSWLWRKRVENRDDRNDWRRAAFDSPFPCAVGLAATLTLSPLPSAPLRSSFGFVGFKGGRNEVKRGRVNSNGRMFSNSQRSDPRDPTAEDTRRPLKVECEKFGFKELAL